MKQFLICILALSLVSVSASGNDDFIQDVPDYERDLDSADDQDTINLEEQSKKKVAKRKMKKKLKKKVKGKRKAKFKKKSKK